MVFEIWNNLGKLLKNQLNLEVSLIPNQVLYMIASNAGSLAETSLHYDPTAVHTVRVRVFCI